MRKQEKLEIIKSLSESLGYQVAKSLVDGNSVFNVWRRSTPWNYWVSNKNGKTLWHSGPGLSTPSTDKYFEEIKINARPIGYGLFGSYSKSPEASLYKIKGIKVSPEAVAKTGWQQL